MIKNSAKIGRGTRLRYTHPKKKKKTRKKNAYSNESTLANAVKHERAHRD